MMMMWCCWDCVMRTCTSIVVVVMVMMMMIMTMVIGRGGSFGDAFESDDNDGA